MRQAQSNMMQTWYNVRTACQQMAEGSADRLSACSKLADTERGLISMMQTADDLVVSSDADKMSVGMHQICVEELAWHAAYGTTCNVWLCHQCRGLSCLQKSTICLGNTALLICDGALHLPAQHVGLCPGMHIIPALCAMLTKMCLVLVTPKHTAGQSVVSTSYHAAGILMIAATSTSTRKPTLIDLSTHGLTCLVPYKHVHVSRSQHAEPLNSCL